MMGLSVFTCGRFLVSLTIKILLFGPLLQIVYQDEGLTICSDVGVPAESSENLAQEGQPLHCLFCGALGGRKAATDGGKCILD